jgi:hypothetical protein
MRAACSTVGAKGIQERTCAFTMCVTPAILSDTNCTQLHWVCSLECSVEPIQITPSLVRKDLRPDLRIRLDLVSTVHSRRIRGGSTLSARQRERVRTNLWAPPSEGIEWRCFSLCASIAQASTTACDDCGRVTARPGASNCESRVKPLRST